MYIITWTNECAIVRQNNDNTDVLLCRIGAALVLAGFGLQAAVTAQDGQALRQTWQWTRPEGGDPPEFPVSPNLTVFEV